MSQPVSLLFTDFRDGLQGEGIEATSLQNSLRAIQAMDGLGAAYHELGFAVHKKAQPRFRAALELGLSGRVAAFGRTHQDDVKAILELGVPVAVVVGKSRQRDAEKSLRVTPRENLELIRISVAGLKASGLEVVYDAEHAFDALVNGDHVYALQTMQAALQSGADWIVLCDTNGGCLGPEIEDGIRRAKGFVPEEKLGFHAHDDLGLAVANSLRAFECGVRHIQGCLLPGFGERCGNAALSVLVPTLVRRYGVNGVLAERLKDLTHVCNVVADAFNMSVSAKTPWVGGSAFYTEAGMHQSGLERDPGSYLHDDPTAVGNQARFGLSDQTGRVGFTRRVRDFLGQDLPADRLSAMFVSYVDLVGRGMDFGLAQASFELFVLRFLQRLTVNLKFVQWRLHVEKEHGHRVETEASLRLKLLDEAEPARQRKLHNADGDGPVNALDEALRRTLKKMYPAVLKVRLTDFSVRMIDEQRGSASRVRVLITFTDGDKTWSTAAADENILEACWEALWDGYIYKLCKG